ncbi:MAG TPA: trehalase family glycosidase [Candidatus Nitrosocosmicus sp.]|nr:trehalase family glycosidase [Candidatus Nitrosocosmicus sp.]
MIKYFNKINSLFKKVSKQAERVYFPTPRPESFDFLGRDSKERVSNLLHKILTHENERANRKDIFEYIMSYWEHALVSLPYKKGEFRGLNLAKRPFLAPSIPTNDERFGFYEQYRWDTYFHNKGFILIGGHNIALDQLLNFVDVYEEYERIPNALTSSFLSHAQPPLESFCVQDLIQYTNTPKQEIQLLVNMIESELVTEWMDYGRHKRYLRQTEAIHEKYGLLTRYTNMHWHTLLAGCEDGKDHNWVTSAYGYLFLPVQLNSIIYGILSFLHEYYSDKTLGNNIEKASEYGSLKDQFALDFQKIFWHHGDKWIGFRNYSIKPGSEGPILYGDLASEVWPLFVKIATPEQAEIIKNNLELNYKGDYGLTTTSLALREGSTIPHAPGGFSSYQWEYPNCWAPLMYIAVEGLRNYGYEKEADEYALNWVKYIEKDFSKTGTIPEKTPYSSNVTINEGLYGMLNGFGWTIGVYLWFLKDLSNKGKLTNQINN